MYNRKYDKVFLILRQEIEGFRQGSKTLTGNCTIELKNGKAKASLYVQGLRKLSGEGNYRVYMISADNRRALGVPAGSLDVDEKGQADLRWSFEADDVAGTGLNIEAFNVVAVVLEKEGKAQGAPVAPLCGYTFEKRNWRPYFQRFGEEAGKETSAEPAVLRVTPAAEPMMEPAAAVDAAPAPLPAFLAAAEEEAKAVEAAAGEASPETESLAAAAAPVETEPSVAAEAAPAEMEAPVAEAAPADSESLIAEAAPAETEAPVAEETPAEPESLAAAAPAEMEPEESSFAEADITLQPKTSSELAFVEAAELAAAPMEDTFRQIARRFRRELDELENAGVLSKKEIAELGVKPGGNSIPLRCSADLLLRYNERLNPFAEAMDCVWVRISPRDMGVLPLPNLRLLNHPFVLSANRKYRHLLLGFQPEGKGYVLGVPDVYSEEYRIKAGRLGFLEFKCCEGGDPYQGKYGYWLQYLQ